MLHAMEREREDGVNIEGKRARKRELLPPSRKRTFFTPFNSFLQSTRERESKDSDEKQKNKFINISEIERDPGIVNSGGKE